MKQVTVKGEVFKSLSDAARAYGMNPVRMRMRLRTMTLEQAFRDLRKVPGGERN